MINKTKEYEEKLQESVDALNILVDKYGAEEDHLAWTMLLLKYRTNEELLNNVVKWLEDMDLSLIDVRYLPTFAIKVLREHIDEKRLDVEDQRA